MSEELYDPTKPQPIGRGYTARVVVGIGRRKVETEFGEVMVGSGAFVLEGPGGTHVCSRKFIEELLGPIALHRLLTGEDLEPVVGEEEKKDEEEPIVKSPGELLKELPPDVHTPDVPELKVQQDAIQKQLDELKRQGVIPPSNA